MSDDTKKLATAVYCILRRMRHSDTCAMQVAMKEAMDADPCGMLRKLTEIGTTALSSPEINSELVREGLGLPECSCEWSIAYKLLSEIAPDAIQEINKKVTEDAIELAGGSEKVAETMKSFEELAIKVEEETAGLCGKADPSGTRHCVRRDHTPGANVHTDGQKTWTDEGKVIP